jgi:phage baseplate assembly protein V
MSIARLANAIRQQARMADSHLSWPTLATISSYDASNHAVKVTVEPTDPGQAPTESNWMPLGAIGIGNGWGVAVGPQIGDQVVVVFEHGDFSSGVIVARIFSVAQTAPAVPSGEVWAVHQQGQFVKLTNDGKVTLADKAGSTVVMNGDGTGTASFASGFTIDANTTINGTLLVTKTVTGQGGIVISGDNGSGNASSVTGNTNFSGRVSANGHRIDDTHEHSGVQTGTGNSGPPL